MIMLKKWKPQNINSIGKTHNADFWLKKQEANKEVITRNQLLIKGDVLKSHEH